MDRLDQIFKLLNFDAMLMTNTSEDFVAAIQVVANVLDDKELQNECNEKLIQIGRSPHYPGNEPKAPLAPIRIDMEGGLVEGYAIERANSDNLFNFLEKNIGGEKGNMAPVEILMALDIGTTVAVVQSLHVDEECRGAGMGALLMQKFFEESNADSMVLLCDTHQEQSEGFSLEKFYEGFDFERVIETPSGPLMIYPPDVAEVAREKLGSKASAPAPVARQPRP